MTQASYDKQSKELNKYRDLYLHGRISGAEAQGQLCLMGYTPERARQVIRNWKEDEYQKRLLR